MHFYVSLILLIWLNTYAQKKFKSQKGVCTYLLYFGDCILRLRITMVPLLVAPLPNMETSLLIFYKSMSALKYTVGPKRRSYHFPCTHIGHLHHEHTDEDASPLSNPLQHWLNRGPSTAGEPLCKVETHCTVLQEQSVSLRTRECSREEIGDKPLFP